jgi:tRNA A37 threonylcarbamoyladenosine biosynthesis protein TsaE
MIILIDAVVGAGKTTLSEKIKIDGHLLYRFIS